MKINFKWILLQMGFKKYILWINNNKKQKIIMILQILMNLKGIHFYENLFSWLITGILQGIIFSTLIIIVMTQCFENPILSYGNSFIIWLFLIFHFGHLTAFGMHIASYFSNSKFYFIFYFLYYFIFQFYIFILYFLCFIY